MSNHFWKAGTLAAIYLFSSPLLRADIRPEKVHVADTKKTKSYIKDGVFVGGDGKMSDFVVKDIRWANNAGFERIVLDLGGNHAPYYHIALSSDENRLSISLSGKAKLDFNPKKVIAAFKRSSMIQNVMLLPPIEGVPWTVVLELKPGSPVEVFELNQPTSARLILDIQNKK